MKTSKPGVLAHTYNPSVWEAVVGGQLQVQSQCSLPGETTLPQKGNKRMLHYGE